MGVISRIKNAWDAFTNRDPPLSRSDFGFSYTSNPARKKLRYGNDRTVITPILNRIAVDVASLDFRHIKVDDNDRYVEDLASDLQNCLKFEANLDQSGRQLIHDAALSMLDEGCIAIVPTSTDVNPNTNDSFKIYELRVGKISLWQPHHVTVTLYNEDTGNTQDVVVSKKHVAIAENPLYAIINDSNSILRRLVAKMALLDAVEESANSNKFNMIIQLPYVVKGELKKAQAETRREELERDLVKSKYGVAYVDGTEKITQLNRPMENKLLDTVKYLTDMLYGQLGMDETILNGTANELTLNNYYTRTVEPIATALADAMNRAFLTKTARTQGQRIRPFNNPFRFVTLSELAQIGDVFTRNEILSSNDIRSMMGFKLSDDPQAEELRNKNMPIEDQPYSDYDTEEYPEDEYDESQDMTIPIIGD